MKKIILLISSLLFLSCTTKKETPEMSRVLLSLKITETDDTNTVYSTKEYFFNNLGWVIESVDTQYYTNSNITHSHTYYYDTDGKIIEEKLDGTTHKTILWNANTATVNYASQQFGYEVEMLHDKISEIHNPPVNGQPYNFYYQYNTEGNLTDVIINQTVVNKQYLNYDTSKNNPYYLLKSIGILYNKEKAYSPNIFASFIIGGDPYYCTGDLSEPDLEYIFDTDDKLIEIIATYPSIIQSPVHTRFEYNYQ